MTEADVRPRARADDVVRVGALLAHDFPGLDVALSARAEDLQDSSARAQVVVASDLPPLPADGLAHMAFPVGTSCAGLGLVFRADDDVLLELRRFYLHPVVFAGAGPGGVGLMTVAATRALAEADVVLADGLCGDEVLRFAPVSADVVPVGKRGGERSADQGEINDRILVEVLRGRQVVRLKGGDPSVFGRLEEEIAVLAAGRLAYRVLPGIGAASSAAAFVGQPLTARDGASELVFSTGRLAGGGRNPFPLESATAPAIALYMSRKVLAARMQDLVAAGYAPETPAAVVEKLGSPAARAVTGTVTTIAEIADRAGITTPAVALVGTQYGEPDHLPLHGVRIWLPAERETGEGQRERLESLGATCVAEPLIEPVALPVDEDTLFGQAFDWVLFTSKRSVDYLFELLARGGLDARWLPRVAAIGAPTMEKLRARGIEPDLVPPEPTRASLTDALLARGVEGMRILFPASGFAPDHIREVLGPVAEEVVRVDLYTLRFPRVAAVPEGVGVVLFSSSSTVQSARENGLIDEIRRRGLLVGGIGPATCRAVEREGLDLTVIPDGTAPDSLARATRRTFARLAAMRLVAETAS